MLPGRQGWLRGECVVDEVLLCQSWEIANFEDRALGVSKGIQTVYSITNPHDSPPLGGMSPLPEVAVESDAETREREREETTLLCLPLALERLTG